MEKTHNISRLLGMAVVSAVLLFSLPTTGRAGCPDRVTCYMMVYNGATYDATWKGNISTPTCWKVGHQCKPWNCSGNSTNHDYWVEQCIRRFNLKAVHKGEKACVTFPEFDRSEKSISGFGDRCYELPVSQ